MLNTWSKTIWIFSSFWSPKETRQFVNGVKPFDPFTMKHMPLWWKQIRFIQRSNLLATLIHMKEMYRIPDKRFG